MPKPRRVVFHIGLEKTGTTSLQACLHRNAKALRRHSILYPRRNLAYGWENHKPLVGCYGIDDVGDKWLTVDPSRRAAVVGSLVEEIESASQHTAVISAEHFSSRFRDKQIAELRADFERFDCSVVVVVRDHLSRLYSSYDTYVTNGGALPLDAFADGMMRPDALDLRYADLIAPWERAFGRDRMEVIAYGPQVVRKVLASLAPGLEGETGFQSFREKASARADVIAALRLANKMTAHDPPSNNAAWAHQTQLRAQIKVWLQEAAQGGPATAFALESGRLARLAEIARLDADRLAERYGLVLAAHDHSIGGGDLEAKAAELLGRALVARADRPWTKVSLLGVGMAAHITFREGQFLARERFARLLQRSGR